MTSPASPGDYSLSDSQRGPASLGPWPATHLLIWGFVGLHLLLAASLPLIAFETHYALYGLHLDWSYVDHPPLVGWIQALVQQFSRSDLAMRVAPVLIITASQYLVAALAMRLFPRSTPWLGFASVLLLQGAVIIHAGIAMAPEVPLLLTGLLVMWFTLGVIEQNRLRDWVGLGVALGLAGLSKYTAITLALSVPLALLSAGAWRLLLQPRALLAVALAGWVVSPVLIWNWQHDWVSFTYQIGYQLEPDEAEAAWSLSDALNMQLQQLGAYSPALYLGGIAGMIWGLRRGDRGTRLSIAFALPVLLLFGYLAGAGRSSPHWTLLGWVYLAPLAALWIIEHWRGRAARYLVFVSGLLSVAVLLVLMVLPLPVLPFPDYGHPLSRLLGWQEAAAKAEALRHQWAEQESGREPVLLVQNWHYAGPLAWYGQPAVVQDAGRRTSQYAFWYGLPEPDTRGILVVFDEEDEIPQVREPGFDCRQVDTMPAYRGATLARMFYFYRCEAAL